MTAISINKRPSDSDTHTWADYVELLALVNLDGTCTVDSAIDRVEDIGGESDETNSNDVSEADEGEGEGEGEGVEPVSGSRKRFNARNNTAVLDAFALILWRASAYGDFYPFIVDQNRRSITLVKEFSSPQYLYVFLLIAANLRFVSDGLSELTNNFEEVSRCVMRDVLPPRAEVHLFGKATAAKYRGSAYKKMSDLCDDIRASLLVTEEDYRKGDSGDSGIDIVAWHGLSDSQKNILVYLGQCACSRSDWPKKQLAASAGQLKNVLATAPDWVTMMFVPVCFRRVGGGWAVLSEVASVVFIDRYRLLKNCLSMEVDTVTITIREIVNAVCSNKEAIV